MSVYVEDRINIQGQKVKVLSIVHPKLIHPIQMGALKAKIILDNLPEIQMFVSENYWGENSNNKGGQENGK